MKKLVFVFTVSMFFVLSVNAQTEDNYQKARKDWQIFYKVNFSWATDFSKVIVSPKPTDGEWRLVFIPKGMTNKYAIRMCSKFMSVWDDYSLFRVAFKEEGLDVDIEINARNTKQDYAIWVRDQADPGDKFLGLSARMADFKMDIGITVLERIILELKYYTETGEHLDPKTGTICSGSRDSRGRTVLIDSSLSSIEITPIPINEAFPNFGIREVR